MDEGDAAVVEVRPGATTTLTLTAKGHGVIEGVVRDWKTREPVAGAACRAVMSMGGQQGATNWSMETAAKSDATGRVVVDPAPAGVVTVICEVAGRSSPAAEVSLARGGRASVELDSVRITVATTGTLGVDFHWMTVPPRLFTVEPDSPAARAGLVHGNLVVAVDGVPVTGLNGPGVGFRLLDHPIGTKVKLTVERGDQRKTAEATVESADALRE